MYVNNSCMCLKYCQWFYYETPQKFKLHNTQKFRLQTGTRKLGHDGSLIYIKS